MKSKTGIRKITKNGNSLTLSLGYKICKKLDLKKGDIVKIKVTKIEHGK